MINNAWGDPCSGVEKYTEIVYECVPPCPVQNVCRCEPGLTRYTGKLFDDPPPLYQFWKLFKIQKRVIRGVSKSVPHQSVANTNSGMNVDIVKRLDAAKAIIVVPTLLHVQPFVNQDVNVPKELVHFSEFLLILLIRSFRRFWPFEPK